MTRIRLEAKTFYKFIPHLAHNQTLPCLQLCGYPQASFSAGCGLELEADSMATGDMPALASPPPPSQGMGGDCTRTEAQLPASIGQTTLIPPVSPGEVPGSPLSCTEKQPLGKALAGRKRPLSEGCDGSQKRESASGKAVLVDFGSVACMGLLGSPSRLMEILVSALSIAGLRAVLLTGLPPSPGALVLSGSSQHR